MTAVYGFRDRLPDSPAAWRPLDRAVARWVRAHGGSSLLAYVAGWASLAEGHGHSALPMTGNDTTTLGMPALDDAQQQALARQPLVWHVDLDGPPTRDCAFVIERGLFYLRRNYSHELAVTRFLQARRHVQPQGEVLSDSDLDTLFDGDARAEVTPQRDAVRQVLGRRLFVLTGGPGTGKTTTVLRMLLPLVRHYTQQHQQPPSIRISAPTGKAAQRLSESLRDGMARLHLAPEWGACLAQIAAADATTLHRMLGSRGRHGGFRYHAEAPLPADIVVVDEASMVELAMLRALLEALPPEATLVLVGDADQLTSVGTGSVLQDLVTALEAEHAPELVRLQHSFRADTALVPINQAILQGDSQAFAAALVAADAQAIRRATDAVEPLRRALARWCDTLYQQQLQAGVHHPIDGTDTSAILTALDSLRQMQLLCALRETTFGAVTINAAVESAIRRHTGVPPEQTWYPGRAVMITRNDYLLGLFNGDIGLCLRDASGQLGVWFESMAPATDSTAATRQPIRFAPGSLPDYQPAFAITIHKSQGSEYQRVAIVLPPDEGNRILSRQLLYTGVSRARQAVEIWSADDPLQAAIRTPVRRSSGLAERLRSLPGEG